MKKYKLVYVKAGHVYGSESGIPSVNDDKFDCSAQDFMRYGFNCCQATEVETPVPAVVDVPVVEEPTVKEPVIEEVQPQPKKNTKKKAAPIAETVSEEITE